MNKDTLAETIIGAIVVIVAVGFLGFALTRAGHAAESDGYALVAHFNKVDGVALGSDVRLAGVKVGTVSGVSLEPSTYMAKLTLAIAPSVKVPEDSAAKIASDGLLGGAYVSIEAGGSDTTLKPGAEISQTQGSVDLITVLSSALSGMNSNNSQTKEVAKP
jgi:phospholipid/cholesterol/gamma-HCH transport system substrate-binding protein